MTTIGFIGSGMIGGTVARLSVAAGHRVVMSNSRGPETLQELVAELGPLATAATAGQAAEAGDLVVVSHPGQGHRRRPGQAAGGQAGPGHRQLLPAARRPDRGDRHRRAHQQRPAPALPAGCARGEGVQQHLLPAPGLLARPSGAADRSALPIAGDDAAAKAAVTAYLDSIGYNTVDAGTARRQLAPGDRHPRLRRALRPVLLRNRPPRQRRHDPHRPSRRPPLLAAARHSKPLPAAPNRRPPLLAAAHH